jgi:hypothetical protein
MPGECAPALARTRGPGHLVVSCQAQGCLAVWYSPRHEPADRAQVAEPGLLPVMSCRELAPVHIPDGR